MEGVLSNRPYTKLVAEPTGATLPIPGTCIFLISGTNDHTSDLDTPRVAPLRGWRGWRLRHPRVAPLRGCERNRAGMRRSTCA